jgi:hypothetical protein
MVLQGFSCNFQWQAQIRRRGFSDQFQTCNTRKEAEAWAATIEFEMARGLFLCRREEESTTLLLPSDVVDAQWRASIFFRSLPQYAQSHIGLRSASRVPLRFSFHYAYCGLTNLSVIRSLSPIAAYVVRSIS